MQQPGILLHRVLRTLRRHCFGRRAAAV